MNLAITPKKLNDSLLNPKLEGIADRVIAAPLPVSGLNQSFRHRLFGSERAQPRVPQAVSGAGVQVVLCTAPSRLQTGLALNLPPSVFAVPVLEAKVDLALERCEEIVIAAGQANVTARQLDVRL